MRPPQDKPTAQELRNCFQYFNEEINLLNHATCMLALGKIAFDACLRFWRSQFDIKVKDYPFKHHAIYSANNFHLISSYHPSPRNVNTKRLTKNMMVKLLSEIKNTVNKFIKFSCAVDHGFIVSYRVICHYIYAIAGVDILAVNGC